MRASVFTLCPFIQHCLVCGHERCKDMWLHMLAYLLCDLAVSQARVHRRQADNLVHENAKGIDVVCVVGVGVTKQHLRGRVCHCPREGAAPQLLCEIHRLAAKENAKSGTHKLMIGQLPLGAFPAVPASCKSTRKTRNTRATRNMHVWSIQALHLK